METAEEVTVEIQEVEDLVEEAVDGTPVAEAQCNRSDWA
jgi:hypothetical protein